MATDPLLQPYRLKHLELRNRLMMTAHEPAYSEDGMPKDRYRLYHVERAKGGIALTMTAGSAIVSPDSAPAFGNLMAYKDEIVPWLRRLSDDCHEHGAAVMIQLTHLGRRSGWNHADWLPVLAPSMVREPVHRSFPKVIEEWDIDRIVEDYATAAARMQEAGLDGLEFEAYGHLMDGFWSPATNKRDDAFGGSLDNRLRFTFRVLERTRQLVGPDFIVGLRMVADEDWEKGISRAEGIEIAQRLVASGQVDFLNIIRGHIETDAALVKVIPVIGMPTAPHIDFVGEVRAATKFPIFHAAGINDVATARHAVAAGKMDMVGMTRAHVADPHIVRKIIAGEEDRIRPCVRATFCIDRGYVGTDSLCLHNPATGREATMPHVITRGEGPAKKIVVVGAGPGGLEAARVAAERGHAVTLFEAQPEAGGQMRLAASTPRRRELIGIVDWRLGRCEDAGVDIRFNTFATAEDVADEGPDLVVIATGGLPNTEILDAGNELLTSTWDILSRDVKPATNVLFFDDNGTHASLQAAEFVAEAGSRLEIVTPERNFAPDVGGLTHVAYMRSFQRHGVTLTIARRLIGVARKGNRLAATIGSDYEPDLTEERLVDQVIVDHATLPLDELYFELRPLSTNLGEVDHRALIDDRPQDVRRNPDGRFQLFRIGDAVAARNCHAAIYEALRYAKNF